MPNPIVNKCFFYVTVMRVKSIFGKNILLNGGYSFCCGKASKTTLRWVCSQGNSCKANIITSKDNFHFEVLRVKNEHNHPPRKYVVRNGIFIRLP